MKIIFIHHRLVDMRGHRYNEACGYVREFGRRGREFLLIANVGLPAGIASRLNARPLMDDPTFNMAWSFEERTRRFVSQFHEYVDADLNAGDCVLVTTCTQVEANALTVWLQELSPAKKPWILMLFGSDKWNRSAPAEYERQMGEFRVLETRIRKLSPEDSHRLIFCSLTNGLAAEVSGLLGVPVAVGPIMLPCGPASIPARSLPDSRARLPRVALLGGARREKGSLLVRDIIRACKGRIAVDFLVHAMNETLTPAEFEEVTRAAEEPGVELIHGPLSTEQYNSALESSGIVLFPYDVSSYLKRASGVFSEAVACGKIVVAPRGTWMAQKLEENGAAGAIFDDPSPASIADAIGRCVRDVDRLAQLARERSAAWGKEYGPCAFIDFMERQIALRQASAVQAL